MKKNFNVPLYNIDGTPLLDDKKQAMKVKSPIVNALTVPDKSDDGEEKVRRYDLALRIYKADGDIEISLEDGALIKKLVGAYFGPVIVGQIFQFLEE